MIFGLGGIIKALVTFITVVVVLGGLWYIINLKANLAISEQNNIRLQDSIKEQHSLIEQMNKDFNTIQETNRFLAEENEKQKKDVSALTRKFDKRDFGAFVYNNPDKAQELINRGTINALRCLELASGAPLNENEKKAKSPMEANRECPSLINRYYTAPIN